MEQQAVTIPAGLCQCGCGGKTLLAPWNNCKSGAVKGQPLRFIYQHHTRKENNPRWNGGQRKPPGDYSAIYCPDHPRATSEGYVLEHLIIVERVIGKPLFPPAEVHHFDEDRTNNRHSNLIVCEDHAYHFLLHLRLRALKACGNPNFRKCVYCHQWDDPASMMHHSKKSSFSHRECNRLYCQKLRQKHVPSSSSTSTETGESSPSLAAASPASTAA